MSLARGESLDDELLYQTKPAAAASSLPATSFARGSAWPRAVLQWGLAAAALLLLGGAAYLLAIS